MLIPCCSPWNKILLKKLNEDSTTQHAFLDNFEKEWEELKQLRGAAEKLEAEDIVRNAQIEAIEYVEVVVEENLNATAAEVTELTGKIAKVQEQALASKSRLSDASQCSLDGRFEFSQCENAGWFVESEAASCIVSPLAPTRDINNGGNGHTGGGHARKTSRGSGLQLSRTPKVSARSRAPSEEQAEDL
jgi:hypothetical protein